MSRNRSLFSLRTVIATLAGILVAGSGGHHPLRKPRLTARAVAQDQYRRRGGAAQCGAHRSLRRQGARLLRQALHRRQHHPVRRRRRRHLSDRRRPGHGHLQPARRGDRAGSQGEADLGPRAAPAAGLRGERRHQDARRPQGQAAFRRRRHRRLQLAGRARRAAPGRIDRRRRAVRFPGHRRPPARFCRRADRRRRAPSGRSAYRVAAQAGRPRAGHGIRPVAASTPSMPTGPRIP